MDASNDAAGTAPNPTIRVLHLTDLHLLADPDALCYGVDTTHSLRACLDHGLSTRPDAILLTGDLADDASEAAYHRLRQMLLATGLPAWVLPGNHDDPAAMRTHLLGGPIGWPSFSSLGEWRLIGLDSRVEGLSHGWVGPEQCARVERLAAADADRPVLVALHHGPYAQCPSSGCQLVDADAFLATLQRCPNVRAVASGHHHRPLDVEGPIHFLTTPATSLCGEHGVPGADPEDFWASHRFDPLRRGYRTIDLASDHGVHTAIHWVP